uniref:RING-type E3 ubiquitin transferase n=1 Tax=Cyprinodon variegatus TaxID=28743 RepID=A0A3Q2CGS6_CYPVA
RYLFTTSSTLTLPSGHLVWRTQTGHFINGFCRFGLRCKYRHETTPIPASQICRYFQKGGCWYGERCSLSNLIFLSPLPGICISLCLMLATQFRVEGVLCPQQSPPVCPTCLLMQEEDQNQLSVMLMSHPGKDAVDHNQLLMPLLLSKTLGTCQKILLRNSHTVVEHSQGPSKSETQENGATAACSNSVEPLLKSKNVVCGICMENVYEKEEQRNRVFGILPNCNHPFCLKCIKLLTANVLTPSMCICRACPQCRVRSAFYVPNKHWVEGEEKENLITAFKKKLGRCSFFERNGFCPFKKDCLYEHVLDSSHVSFSVRAKYYLNLKGFLWCCVYIIFFLSSQYFSDDSDDDDDSDLADLLNIIINMSLWRQEELDEDLLFFLTEDFGF